MKTPCSKICISITMTKKYHVYLNISFEAIQAFKLPLQEEESSCFLSKEKLRNYCMSIFKYYENIRNQGGLAKFTIGLRALDWKLESVAPFLPLSCCICSFHSKFFAFPLISCWCYVVRCQSIWCNCQKLVLSVQGWEYESCLCMSVGLLSTSKLCCKETLHHFRV